MGKLAGEKGDPCRMTSVELKEIYKPIKTELSLVEKELWKQAGQIKNRSDTGGRNGDIKKIINHFFKVSGKRLRPALVLLSAKAASVECLAVGKNPRLLKPRLPERGGGQGKLKTENLIKLATAMELIHSASLIHDDIIDNSKYRRKQLTLNEKYGNHRAVLIGDLVYTRVFSLLIGEVDTKILDVLLKCVEKMCISEVNAFNSHASSFKEYIKIIDGKTASFMSACCKTGAMLSGADDDKVNMFAEFGHNFGISYQLMDDFSDSDSTLNSQINLAEAAEKYAACARKNIEGKCDSEYRKSLEKLSGYIIRPFRDELPKTLAPMLKSGWAFRGAVREI